MLQRKAMVVTVSAFAAVAALGFRAAPAPGPSAASPQPSAEEVYEAASHAATEAGLVKPAHDAKKR